MIERVRTSVPLNFLLLGLGDVDGLGEVKDDRALLDLLEEHRGAVLWVQR